MAEYGTIGRLRRGVLFAVVISVITTGGWIWSQHGARQFAPVPKKNHFAKADSRQRQCIQNHTLEPEKIILLWFAPFHDIAMVAENLFTTHTPTNLQRISWNTASCGHCRITYNREMLSQSDAVIFHSFYPSENESTPQKSRKDQKFVWWSQESSRNHAYYRYMQEYFDWTMTPSRFSDVYSPYASFPWMLKFLWRKARGVDIMAKMAELKGVYVTEKDDLDYVLQRYFGNAKQPRILKIPSRNPSQNLLSKKLKLAAWVASNCRTTGGNTRLYVVENMEEIGLKIDKYGSCNYNDISISRWDPAFFEILSRYKFYLSFENSIHCRDYITEKLWFNALYSGAVPIIWGPHRDDVKAVLPPKSYIHVEDFSSLGKLVKYIQYLDKNDTAYLEYLEWRNWIKYLDKKGEYHPENIRKLKRSSRPDQNVRMILKNYAIMEPVGFCKLCRMLHAQAQPAECRQPSIDGRGVSERAECLQDEVGERIADRLIS